MNSSVLITIPLEDFKSLISETIRNEVSNLIPSEAPKQEDQELITESECCKRLHRSKVTLNDWRKRGFIPFYRISRKIYYNWSDVLSALKKIERKAV